MTVYLDDADLTLHQGDALEELEWLESGSVDCVITSPPYWGLRDYGTGEWEGGDPDCDHLAPMPGGTAASGLAGWDNGLTDETVTAKVEQRRQQHRVACPCGARRVDQQLGLEPTPDEYITRMVGVFREVRRVLADHGTCWVNMGDSYAAGGGFAPGAPSNQARLRGETVGSFHGNAAAGHMARAIGSRTAPAGLKPKDLCGIPWRLALALQADGWWLRSCVIWAKPNPMPESVTDRPTTAHEYVFLLTKAARYFYDADAVREPSIRAGDIPGGGYRGRDLPAMVNGGHFQGEVPANRNLSTVWEIPTQPYPEAHFATYPEELVRRCLLAGCPERVCRECGEPSERVSDTPDWYQNLGFTDCGHDVYRPGIVLDPFLGSGTTALVARKHGRRCVGIELSPEYCELAARRLQQLSLLAV